MATVNKITKAGFADDTSTADILRVTFFLYDDAVSVDSEGYAQGVIDYDFVNSKPSASGVKDLAEVADVKLLIEGMIASRAKNTISLPVLVKSITVKDGVGAVTSYNEVY